MEYLWVVALYFVSIGRKFELALIKTGNSENAWQKPQEYLNEQYNYLIDEKEQPEKMNLICLGPSVFYVTQ